MRVMGSPFILFSDKTSEWILPIWAQKNWKVKCCIDPALGLARLWAKDMNFSGLSVGTFGALYYGALYLLLMRSWSENHYKRVSLPIWNLNDPDEFGTSLDMIQLIIGQASPEEWPAQSNASGIGFDQAVQVDFALAIWGMMTDQAYQMFRRPCMNCRFRIIGTSRAGRQCASGPRSLSGLWPVQK